MEKESIGVDSFSDTAYFLSSVIVHEACHSFQHENNMSFSEQDCTTTQYNYLKNTGASAEELQKIEQITRLWGAKGYALGGNDIFLAWKQKTAG